MTKIDTIGIIGAGKLGTAIGRIAAASGHEVLIFSRPNPMHKLVLPTVLPTATMVEFDELASRADVVVLAVPHHATAELDLPAIRGVIIDATNPWEATGSNVEMAPPMEAHPELPIARTLNHVSYEELVADALPESGQRRALTVAALNDEAAQAASDLVRSFGFDPVRIDLEDQHLFNADGRLFGAWLSADELRAQVSAS